ncbi:hypothetical protein JI739_19340 [Ramlibacter sp. AW1]|uniref:Uncharacterized protein n=1 Tax=Ramlibacter aurantiacus TaxID=2801330 RepID=A0A937D3C1_9BURK|nr:hypothetical protein [Ramlibacter aurantiacus]MBL0422509.1 hypothetical protein [Ramlibacter aurantiacus]
MTDIESPSAARRPAAEVLPRHPQREIAELLAAAILRMRARKEPGVPATDSEVSVGFPGDQRLNANPVYTQGVRI